MSLHHRGSQFAQTSTMIQVLMYHTLEQVKISTKLES